MTAPKLPEGLEPELRLLAASMRHSAGQWMVPGWDGHKVADLLEKAQAALQALAAEKDAEIAALTKLRDALNDMYQQLAEAMGYHSGEGGMEFSPEEWAAALKADAARYRWLVHKFGVTSLPCMLEPLLDDYVADGKESLDAAIDSALALAAKEAK
jgi:hypothetical protein